MTNELSTERAIEALYTVRAYYASLTAGYPKGKDCRGIGDVMCSEIANSCLMAIKALEQQPSDDYISRESLRQKLQEHLDFFVNAYGSFEDMTFKEKARVDEIDNCIAMVVNEPSVTPQPRWIPVSERLPKANGRYVVTRGLNACGALWNRVYIVNYSDLMGLKSERIWWDGNVGKSDFKRIDDVIAWMPLPEPYKPEIKTEQALAYADQDTLMPAT